MDKIWKIIPNFENYSINNLGEIQSHYTNKILKPSLENQGYLAVTLYKNKKPKRKRIHQLVALAFINNPKNKPQVNHKDCNKQNNFVSNLEWTTHKENMEHASINNLVASKEKQGISKLNILIVEKIRKLYNTKNFSQRQLAKKFNVCQRTITMIINHLTWKTKDK